MELSNAGPLDPDRQRARGASAHVRSLPSRKRRKYVQTQSLAEIEPQSLGCVRTCVPAVMYYLKGYYRV